MLNRYNAVAPFYTLLARLVFGNSLLAIQKNAIDYLPQSGKLLILGGGNGDILKEIVLSRPKIEIEYLEASDMMLEQAKKNSTGFQTFRFIHSDQFIDCSKDVNAVFMPFILDLFDEEQIINSLYQLKAHLSKKHLLIVADFDLNNFKVSYWNKLKVKMSILFSELLHLIN
ncbi:MAG: hypothetical protein RLZZ337_676 [Bacteroidota bacterium]